MTTASVTSGPIDERWLGPDRYQLLAPLVIDLGESIREADGYPGFDVQDDTTIITLHEGFILDWSSIPNIVELFLGDREHYKVAGGGHDLAYRVGVPRKPADRIWWIIARSGELRVQRLRARVGYRGLRWFGGPAYRQHRARDL